ncbi:hypothetical protein DSECCO2_358260 [anaerobic digester metagenome]
MFRLTRGERQPFRLKPVEPTSIALHRTNSIFSHTRPSAQTKNMPFTVGAVFLESWIVTSCTFTFDVVIISQPRFVILRSLTVTPGRAISTRAA